MQAIQYVADRLQEQEPDQDVEMMEQDDLMGRLNISTRTHGSKGRKIVSTKFFSIGLSHSWIVKRN